MARTSAPCALSPIKERGAADDSGKETVSDAKKRGTGTGSCDAVRRKTMETDYKLLRPAGRQLAKNSFPVYFTKARK